MTVRLVVFGMMAVAIALSCASPNEPVPPDGHIVLRFESGAAAMTMVSPAAASFDSVAVRVFRPGASITEETSRGVALTGTGPIDVALTCIAENHKRVSVELFSGRAMTYHGANTDVNVVADRQTQVSVDAYEFVVDTLVVSPQAIVPQGTSYTLRWNRAVAATSYLVQSSVTPSFGDVEWEQSVTDTVVGYQASTGSHYFRVVPRTQYANGNPAGPKFGYVTGGGDKVKINALVPGRVIPGELFTIVGENLDYPGTTATIGADDLAVVRASYDSLVVRLPRAARTNFVTVIGGTPALATDTSDKELVALRVAYVTATGEFATEYVTELEKRNQDFDNSGVAVIPIEELDTRDMGVFDIVAVAHDTGTLPVNWGGGEPSRATAITQSDAEVLAIGRGGAVFLALVVPGASYPTTATVDTDKKYFARDVDAAIFTTPHAVTRPDLGLFDNPPPTIAFDISSPYPASVNLYASTGKNCLIVCSPNDQWALADFRFANGGRPAVYFFFGFAGNPEDLNAEGGECLANIMYMLNNVP
jgi:hypothetical protein